MAKKALVTGASGFVGSAVARELQKNGYLLNVLTRPTSPINNLAPLEAEVVFGDLRDKRSLLLAMEGCQYLFHVAANYQLWSLHPKEIYHTNVDGTRNVMEAALEQKLEKIVYTSSVATLGLRPNGIPADEDTAVSFEDMVGDYKKSKYLAEGTVQKMVREAGLPAVIVNPSTPIGPGDIKPTPTGKLILDAASGRMPAFVDTGLNWVHVDDVAIGHRLALERGIVGERYILGNENFSLKEMLNRISAITGKRPPKIKLPHNLVLPFAYMAEWWANTHKSKNPPIATVSGVKLSKKKMYFSIDKARNELGYEPGDVGMALQDAITWFRENGYL